MEINTQKLREVLHEMVVAMGTMFNSSEKVLQEARDKIESIFSDPTVDSTVEPPTPSEPAPVEPAPVEPAQTSPPITETKDV